MRIKPLTGQVLIEVSPPPKESPGGVALPGDVALSAEIVQERSHNPEKPPAMIGTVKAIGGWPGSRTAWPCSPNLALERKWPSASIGERHWRGAVAG